ncbi:hypothetical protein EON80_02840, partial [bacterium]
MLAPGGPFLLPIVKSSRLTRLPLSPTRFTASRLTAFGILLVPVVAIRPALAQDDPLAPPSLNGAPVPPEKTPTEEAPGEVAPTETPADPTPPVAPGIEVNPSPGVEPARAVNSGRDLPAPAAQPSQLFATQISYNGGVIIAEGTAESPVRFVTNAGELKALRIQLDTINQVVEASGEVRLERQTEIQRRELRARSLGRRRNTETVRETLVGQNLHYDFKNSVGKLDSAEVQLASLSISAGSLLINGKRYSATNVVLRPGALSPAERKIYGTPPLSIRAKSIS